MIELHIEQLLIYIIPFFRINAFLIASPILGSNYIPIKIKIILALLLNIIITSNLNYPLIDFKHIILIIINEIAIGLILGFIMQMFMSIFNVAGQIIATQMGLGFAANLDPNNGVYSAVIGQLFIILASLLFLSLNLHLLLIDILINSFNIIPNLTSILFNIAHKMSWIFTASLLLSLPVITILLSLNILFGLISKFAHGLNIFSLGFSLTLIVGLLLIYIYIKGFIEYYNILAHNLLSWINELSN